MVERVGTRRADQLVGDVDTDDRTLRDASREKPRGPTLAAADFENAFVRLQVHAIDALPGDRAVPDLHLAGETGQRVDVIGTSKGRGTAGVVKRHNFAIKRKTHGTHEATRHGGSIGAGAYPGRVFKGFPMAGRMGNERVTASNLEVVKIDADRSLNFVRGSGPGHRNGIVTGRAAVKAKASSPA